ncbi:MAG TPA: class I SAM-dependent methyltransferase [Ktedonobacteraceae bacterium]|nr:class I SAM-dependent methyltransferase [Ktedonobacteraceae bacterium]
MTPQLRRLLFETLYRNKYLYRFASTVPFAGQWRAWQRLVLPRLRGNDVLELGCGLGDLQADMQDAGFACQAVEHSPQMVAAARETLRKRGTGSPGNIIQGRAQGLPFSSNSFDNVVSTFPSEYIFDADTISEVARVLRPGGRLIVVEGANLLPIGFFQPILMLLQMLVYGRAANTAARRQAQQQATNNGSGRVTSLDKETGSGLTTEVVEQTNFGSRIPLEQFGLRRRSELVRSRRWIVSLTIGEKAGL